MSLQYYGGVERFQRQQSIQSAPINQDQSSISSAVHVDQIETRLTNEQVLDPAGLKDVPEQDSR